MRFSFGYEGLSGMGDSSNCVERYGALRRISASLQ